MYIDFILDDQKKQVSEAIKKKKKVLDPFIANETRGWSGHVKMNFDVVD